MRCYGPTLMFANKSALASCVGQAETVMTHHCLIETKPEYAAPPQLPDAFCLPCSRRLLAQNDEFFAWTMESDEFFTVWLIHGS